MYVCLCRGVTDATIRAAVAAGARDLEELGRRTEAGTGCLGCWEALEDLIREVTAGDQANATDRPHATA